MAVAMIGPKFYAWDRNGKPLAFGKLYTYQARTNEPKDTYQSEDQAVANTNPVILNGEGYTNVYLDGSYKMVLKDDKDNEIWSSDPVSASQPTEWVNCLQATYLSPTSFEVGGNFTTQYKTGVVVRIDNNTSEYSYSTVVSSSFAADKTTIVVSTGVVTTGIINVCNSILGPDAKIADLSQTYNFDTVADMQNSTIVFPVGKKVHWMGYHEQSDGGSNWGIVKSGSHTEDGGSIFTLSDGNYVEANLKGKRINVKKFGVIEDGVADDRIQLQRAIDKSVGQTLVFNNKEYYCSFSGNKLLSIPSNTTIDGGGGKIICPANDKSTYQMLFIDEEENVTINNLSCVGDLSSHTGSSGEAGHGVHIQSSKNIKIIGGEFSECWGDGIYIRSLPESTNYDITIDGVVCDKNRRQALSLTGGINITIKNSKFKNTGTLGATSPCAGIDFEQNSSSVGDLIATVENCQFSGNLGGAFHGIFHNALESPTIDDGLCVIDVKVVNCSSFKDGEYGGTIGRGAIRVGAANYNNNPTNKIIGGVNIDNFTITKPQIAPVWMTNYSWNMPKISINGLCISDIDDGAPLGITPSTTDDCLIYMQNSAATTTDPTFSYGKISVGDIEYTDSRGDTFSDTVTETNHRLSRVLWADSVINNSSMYNLRFSKLVSEIIPKNYTLFFVSPNVPADFYSKEINENYNSDSSYGTGLTLSLVPGGDNPLVITLPEAQHVGKVIRYTSSRYSERVVFRAYSGDEYIFSENNTKTSAQFEPTNSANEWTFKCVSENLWVQI